MSLLGGSGPDVSQSFWGANVALWLISAVGYALLTIMAAIVWRGFRRLERGDQEVNLGATHGRRNVAEHGNGVEMQGGETRQIRTRGIGEGKRVRDWQEEMLTEDQRAERLRKAEEKWKKVSGL